MATRHSSRSGRVAAVGYLRRSTGKQEDSLEVQRGLIQDFADRNGFRVTKWYVDDAITGDSESRSEFQRMLADADNGKFDAVLCRSLSRFSRFRPSRAAKYWDMLDAAGVRLVTVEDGEVDVDDFASFLKATVDQHADHKFLADISKLTIGGQVKSVMDGYVAGQPIPYGMDKLILDENGEPRQRVKAGERFHKPKTWRSVFVPAEDRDSVQTVRWMFQAYANTDTGLRGLADDLNQRSVPAPRGGRWHQGTIRDMLRNPCYVGNYRWNKRREGKYHSVDDGKAAKRHRREVRGDKASVVYNDPSEWIVRENAHEGIIAQDVFDRVQQKLHDNTQRRGSWKTHNRGRYLLSGLVRCGHCGAKMHGTRCTRKKDGKTYEYARYICSTYVCHGASQCGHHHIRAELIHGAIVEKLKALLAAANNRKRLRAALEREAVRRRHGKADTKAQVAKLKRQAADLDAKVRRAAERILSVPDDLVDDLTAALADMKAQRRDVLAKLQEAEKAQQPYDVSQAVEGALAKLADLEALLAEGESPEVREFFQRAIGEVTLHFDCHQQKKRKLHTFRRGTVRFNANEPSCQVLSVAGTGFGQDLTIELTPADVVVA